MKLFLVFLVFISLILKDNKNSGFFSKVWDAAAQTELFINRGESRSSFFIEKKLKTTQTESQVKRKKNQPYSLVKKNSKQPEVKKNLNQPEKKEVSFKKSPPSSNVPYISRTKLISSQISRRVSSAEIRKSVDQYFTAISGLCKKNEKMSADKKLNLCIKYVEGLKAYIEEKIGEPLRGDDEDFLTDISSHIQSENFPYKEIMKQNITSKEKASNLKDALEQGYRLSYGMGEEETIPYPSDPWMGKILQGLSCIAEE